MIVTRQRHIPPIWLLMTMLPWAFYCFQGQVNSVNFYILNRLIDNPAALTFVLGMPGLLFTILPLGAFINFKSDRIWTRWGRRKPFIIAAFSGWALVLFLFPLAPNIYFFVTLMFMMTLFNAFNAPLEPLKFEIIPPYLRGRSSAIWTWMMTILNIAFFGALIGRIDEVVPFLGFHLGGDKLLFWCASAALLIPVLIYLLGIHEINPKSTITGEPFRIDTFWRALTMPQLRYLYVFCFANSFLAASLGQMGTLLYINQWGYSVQEMGFNVAVGAVINLFLIPVIGFLADMGKKNRMRIYLGSLLTILLLNVCYFSYVTWYLPDQRPSLVEIIFFGEMTTVFGIVAGTIYLPLIYDYVPRNIMGTYAAGAGILGSIFSFISLNGMGLFMLGWAQCFQPPAGEMVRICLREEMPQAQVQEILRNAGLLTPKNTKAASQDIYARPWFANGIVNDKGICYEVRLRDADADGKSKRCTQLKSEIGIEESKLKGELERHASPEVIAGRQAGLAGKQKEYDSLTTELNSRTSAWEKQVVAGMSRYVMPAGSEVLRSSTAQTVVFTIPATRRLKNTESDKLNHQLRAGNHDFIGVRATPRQNGGFDLSVCALLSDAKNTAQVSEEYRRKVMELAARMAPDLIRADAIISDPVVKTAGIMDIALVENPVRNFVSPISRVVNFVLSQFTTVPPPDQKLHSLARELCADERIVHARVESLSGRNGLHVVAVGESLTPGDSAGWQSKLLEVVRIKSVALKLTVLTPVVGNGVLPLQYNYMIGYVFIFAMVLIGFCLVRYFIHVEKAGKIRKLGAEEAQMEEHDNKVREETAELARNSGVTQEAQVGNKAETYTPGYLVPKLVLTVAGLLIAALAVHEAWPDLKVLLYGGQAEGSVVAVVMKKQGLPDIVLKTQAELNARIKEVAANKDYGWSFYDEFIFETREGKTVTFQRDVGCKLRPTFSMLDESGLPTTAPLRYDRINPTLAMLPLEYSTWFAPALVGLIGIVAAAVGAIMAWHARKPIELHSSVAVNIGQK